MKQTNFLKSFFLLFALIVGSSSVWGQEQTYSTCLFGGTHGGSNNYTDTWTATNGGFLWSVANGNTNKNNTEWDYVKFGRKNTTSVGKVTTSAAYSAAITKVVVTIDAITADKINSIKLYTSSNNTTWTEAGTFTKATGAQSVSLSSPTSDLYYKVEFDCASGSSNGLISVSKIEYKYSADGSKSTTTTVSPTDWTFNLADGVNTKTLSAMVTNDEDDSEIDGATVTWESSDEDVATVNSSGVVTPKAVGTATITATYAGVAKTWAESSGTCAVTVENVFSTIDLTSTASLSFTDFSVLDNSTSAYYYDDDDIDFDGSDGKYYRWKLKDASNQYTTSTTMRLKPNSGYVKFPSVKSTYGYVVNIAYTSGGSGKPSINDGETTTTIENNTDFIVSKATAPLNIMNSSNNVITISRITITPAKILAPTIALAAGTYKTAQTTKLTNVAGFGDIYYTTDGSDPTAGGGTLYNTDDDIAINNGLTLKAAVKYGTDWGYVSEATYVIKPDAPVLGTTSGNFYDDFTLTITAGDGLTIRYTTDGSEPTTSSTLYTTTGVEISCNAGESVTVKAKAFDTYNNVSDMVSATYSKIKHTATMSFASTSLTVKTTSGPVTETLPTLTVASEDGDASDAKSAVRYSSSDTETATVDELTGAVTAVKAGTVTITAAISDNINWYNVSTSYSLTLGYSDAEVEFENSSKTVTYGETFNGFTANKTTTASLTYTSSNPKVATVVAGTGVVTILSVGETTITASAPEQNPYNAGEASYTLTINEVTSYPTALQTILDEKFSKIANTSGNNISANNCDYTGWTNITRVQGFADHYVQLASGSGAGSMSTGNLSSLVVGATISLRAKGKAASNTLTLTPTNCTLDKTSINTTTSWDTYTFNVTAVSGTPSITFGAAKEKQVYLDDILISVNVQTVPVTINASGLTSFCSPYKLDLNDEASQCEAWAISSYDVDKKKINFQKVTGVVPANTPLILMGEEGEKTMAVCQDENEDGVAPSPNKLRGFISPTYYAGPTEETYFGLVKSTGNFKKMNAGTIPAGKAVLVMNTDDANNLDFSDGSKFTFFFEESTETDGIRTTNVNVQVFDGNYYNLAGQRVSEDYKGVVIYNGKKIIKK